MLQMQLEQLNSLCGKAMSTLFCLTSMVYPLGNKCEVKKTSQYQEMALVGYLLMILGLLKKL